MRILLTNSSLAGRTGSELYILDVARELLRTGHQPICYSPLLGDVAHELRQSMVPVTDQLNSVRVVPDVIHGQHHMETLTALLRFPGVPAIQQCHGWTPWEEVPLDFPRIYKSIVVSTLVRESLIVEHGIPESRIALLSNFFDGNRFKARTRPLPAKPKRALAFSNDFDSKVIPIRRACQRFGMSLDVIGVGAGNIHRHPEHLLHNYDVVFARGRAAIEAMACGAAVICCGPDGTGPLIMPANLDALRALNFGIRTSTGPYEAGAISTQIGLYDAGLATQVSARIRDEATVTGTVARLVNIYNEAIANKPPPDLEGDAQAVSSYLRQWSPRIKGWAEKMRQIERLGPANQILEAEVYRLQAEVAEISLVKDELALVKDELGRTKREVQEISGSLTWRIPMAIMNWKPFSILGVFSRAMRKKPKSDPAPIAEEREPNTTSDAVQHLEFRP